MVEAALIQLGLDAIFRTVAVVQKIHADRAAGLRSEEEARIALQALADDLIAFRWEPVTPPELPTPPERP